MRATQHLATLLAVILFLAGCAKKAERKEQAEQYIQQAAQLEAQEKYAEAIPLLDKAIEADPQSLSAYLNRAADKSALGKYKEAIEDYEKALKIDPDNTLALFNIGNNHKRLEDYPAAVDHYNKAIATQVEKATGKSAGDSLGPYDVPAPVIGYERGLVYYELDSLALSVLDMQACIQLGYNIQQSHYMIGANYFIAGLLDQACPEFKIAADMGDPDGQRMYAKHCK